MPKRGFASPNKSVAALVNVESLVRFADGAVVDPAAMLEAGMIKSTDFVKVLGGGELGRKLTVKAHAFSASGKAKIEAAGGVCEIKAD